MGDIPQNKPSGEERKINETLEMFGAAESKVFKHVICREAYDSQ